MYATAKLGSNQNVYVRLHPIQALETNSKIACHEHTVIQANDGHRDGNPTDPL